MHKLFTLGYTSTSPEEMKDMLDELGAILGDIRFNPRSRAPRWNIQQISQVIGPSRYRFLGMWLGNKNYNNNGPIELVKPEKAVEWLGNELQKQPVILMCACFDHRSCHRLTAANYIVEKLGCEIEHLYGSRKG